MVGSGKGIPGPKLFTDALVKEPVVGSGKGIPGPKLFTDALVNEPVVGSGKGIPGPKLVDATVGQSVVGQGNGIPGPNEGAAKAAEVETVRAATAARRTKVDFMGVLLDRIWIKFGSKLEIVWPNWAKLRQG